MRIFIDTCGGGCIRFRDNMIKRLGRDGCGNRWVRCRGKLVGILTGTIVAVRRSAGTKLVVVVVGTGTGSTEVEGLERTPVKGLAGTLVIVVTVNRGSVAGILTGTGTRTGTSTTDLICNLYLLTPPSGFF